VIPHSLDAALICCAVGAIQLLQSMSCILLIAAAMANPAGESRGEVLMLDFNRRLMVQFRGSGGASDAGLLAHCELDEALGLSTMAANILAGARTGRNRQSVFGRLAGYADGNSAERLRHDAAMRWTRGFHTSGARIS
jgi:Transposase DDE domain group 1